MDSFRYPCLVTTSPLSLTRLRTLINLGISGVANSLGVTGGEYKTRERIHRGLLFRDY